LRKYDDRAPIGTGSNDNFVELNRGRPDPDGLDFVCYSVNPQIHATDNDTLIEALEAQAWTVVTAKKFANGLPVFVTPVTFKPRHRSSSNDPRQASLFGAAWTLGSLKYLAESGASCVTYFETHGPRGIQTGQEKLSGENTHYPPRSVFPLYHVLALIAEYAGAKVLLTHATHPLKVDGLALRKGDKLRFLCGNFTGHKESFVIQGLPLSGSAVLRELDEDHVEQAMLSPEKFLVQSGREAKPVDGKLEIELSPCGIAWIDAEAGS